MKRLIKTNGNEIKTNKIGSNPNWEVQTSGCEIYP